MRPGFRLYCENTKGWKNIRVSKIVASIFCFNKYDNDVKTVAHHKDGDISKSTANNLEILSYSDHAKEHLGKRTYLYDADSKKLIRFRSIPSLAEYLDVNRRVIDNAIYRGKIKTTTNTKDGKINLARLKNVPDKHGQPVLVGYLAEAKTKKDSVTLVDVIIGGVVLYGLYGLYELYREMKKSA
jgi:hypothetical protein